MACMILAIELDHIVMCEEETEKSFPSAEKY